MGSIQVLEGRVACFNPPLNRASGASDILRCFGLGGPGCAPLEAVHCLQALAELAGNRTEELADVAVKIGTSFLVHAIEDFIDHGDHPFRVLKVRSEAFRCHWRASSPARPDPG